MKEEKNIPVEVVVVVEEKENEHGQIQGEEEMNNRNFENMDFETGRDKFAVVAEEREGAERIVVVVEAGGEGKETYGEEEEGKLAVVVVEDEK